MIVETFLRNEFQEPEVIKLDHSYDIRQIRSEIGHILREEKKCISCSGRQVMLAVVPHVSVPDHYGCGTHQDPFAVNSDVPSTSFSNFNPKYKGYFLEKIWQTFPFKIGRMAIMLFERNSCLALTENANNRLVYAVQTTEAAHYLYEQQAKWYHIPDDEHLYLVKAKKRHTVYNGSNDQAVHLIFELID